MTSNARRAESEKIYPWSDYAQKLIVDGYIRINDYVKGAKKRDGYSDGTILNEVIGKLHSVPPLLTPEEFNAFRRSEGLHEAEDITAVIRSILKDVCDEKRLRSSITEDDESGKMVVILRK
jgi:hypothetical protein